jgi:hypothetical protein
MSRLPQIIGILQLEPVCGVRLSESHLKPQCTSGVTGPSPLSTLDNDLRLTPRRLAVSVTDKPNGSITKILRISPG